MEKLLYESVGEHKKVKAVVTVVCAVLVVCGVALILFSQLKTSSFGMGTSTTQYIEGIGAVTKYNAGKVYLFSEGVRFGLIAAGFLLCQEERQKRKEKVSENLRKSCRRIYF